MKAIITVVGPDRVGIIGEICTLLAGMEVNIVDISQTVMHGFFTMTMLVDTSIAIKTFDEIAEELQKKQYTAAAGGGVVSATVSGKKELVKLEIDFKNENFLDAMVLCDAFERGYGEFVWKKPDYVQVIPLLWENGKFLPTEF